MLVINYIKTTDINIDNYRLLSNTVSEERRIKANRFYFIDDSIKSVCSELLLRYSLFQAVGQIVDMDIAYNEFGKPFMKYMDNFSYNISHSGKWVVIVYGRSEVGIDIEKIQADNEDICNRFFNYDEIKFIYAVSEKERMKRFTQIWTLKESYIKYLGTGLSTSLNSFSVNALDGVVTNQYGEIQKDLKLKSYPFDMDYYLSVCSFEEEVTFHEVRLEDLIIWIKYHQT